MNKNNYNFKEGEILLVDKPLHWTSFDVVNKLRWRLSKKHNVKRFKVGHAGTLDPLASGLLIICTGKKTKISGLLTTENKTYEGTILLGKSTPSYDLETEFDNFFETQHITEKQIFELAESFLGKQLQTPPLFSAKKVNGNRAYKMARSGKNIELKENEITISSFIINSIQLPEICFTINCSKGTYIRTVAHDFGKKLNSGATLIELRRISSGNFKIEDAKSVEEWLKVIDLTEVNLE